MTILTNGPHVHIETSTRRQIIIGYLPPAYYAEGHRMVCGNGSRVTSRIAPRAAHPAHAHAPRTSARASRYAQAGGFINSCSAPLILHPNLISPLTRLLRSAELSLALALAAAPLGPRVAILALPVSRLEATENQHAMAPKPAAKSKVEARKKQKGEAIPRTPGQWIPCKLRDYDLRGMEKEGLIAPRSESFWRVNPRETRPEPESTEVVMMKSHVERGLSLPPSDFFSEVMKFYVVNP